MALLGLPQLFSSVIVVGIIAVILFPQPEKSIQTSNINTQSSKEFISQIDIYDIDSENYNSTEINLNAGHGFYYGNITNKDVSYNAYDTDYLTVLGEIKNKSNKNYSTTKFIFTVYDQKGKLLDTQNIYIDNINSGETKTFKIDFNAYYKYVKTYKVQFESGY